MHVNVTLWRVCVTIVGVEMLHFLCGLLHVIVSDMKILSGAEQCFLSHLCRRQSRFVARSSCKRYFCPVLAEFVVCGRIKSLISDFTENRPMGNLMPELPNTAHSCSQHGPASVWLKSERPENVIRTVVGA
jgi:hypothetical protein